MFLGKMLIKLSLKIVNYIPKIAIDSQGPRLALLYGKFQ